MGKQDVQKFGGPWTQEKLAILDEYLNAYMTALKKQPFQKVYIDAFAGTGYIESRAGENRDELLLFPEMAEKEVQDFRDGSARIALGVEPRFDAYAFVETSQRKAAELELLREQHVEFRDRISINRDDCNRYLQEKCSEVDWKHWRGVLFLDPYGMAVEWTTMEAVAKTQALDTWILFPVSAANRLMRRDAKVPDSWRARLDAVFGSPDWEKRFYTRTPDLFDPGNSVLKKQATLASIGRYYLERLQDVFAGVADKPRILRNSRGTPLYMLFFAAGNPRGKAPALRIANWILNRTEII